MSDDDLHEFDLSAWEAPPPPRDLADGVIARVRDGAPAVEVDAEPQRMAPRARQRLVGGAAIAALAIAAALLIWLGPGASHEIATSDPGAGSSSGSDARKLVLPGAIATLDPGADVTWHRSGDDLVVTQRAGNATWQVDGSHRLVLDTGAVGASVEATGASLRVEIPMNLMDKRVLAGSALTAGIVAFATVTVYEGHVKKTTAAQTVIVKPGVEVVLSDDVPTVKLEPSGSTLPVDSIAEPSGDYVQLLTAGILTKNHEVDDCATRFHAPPKVLFDVVIDHSGVAGINPKDGPDLELGSCLASIITDVAQRDHVHDVIIQFGWGANVPWSVSGPVKPAHTSHTVACDAQALADLGKKKLATNDYAGALKALADSLDCKDDASLFPSAYLAACAVPDEKAAKHYFNMFTPTRQTQLLPICLRAGIDPRAEAVRESAPACDAKALADQGRKKLAVNDFVGALSTLEASLACKDDPSLYPSAYMAACGSSNIASAKHWFSKLPPTRQTTFAQICMRSGVDPR